MKLSQKQLRRIIAEVISEDAFNLAHHGQPKKITGQGGGKWKAVGADARMAANALQRVSDAVMDEDEEAAGKWLQAAERFAKKAYNSLLGGGSN
jgi:hypothetical protein